MHPLLAQLAAVRRKTKAQLLLFATARLVLFVGGAWLALGALDYWLRFRDPGVRLIWSLAAWDVVAWAAYRYLLPALRYRPRDVELAQQIEWSFPQVHDRLASTVEFLHQAEDDPTAGSLLLRRRVIAQTEADLAPHDLSLAVDTTPARRAASWAALPLATVVALLIISPSSFALGLTRIAVPFSGATWPQTHRLQFTDEITKLAQGKTFEVELTDQNGRLPDEVRMHYRYLVNGKPGDEQIEKMQFVNNRMVARRENVQRPFEYRAEGGDDQSLPWIAVEVVEPPKLESLKITLTPPAYTGRPAEKSDRMIRALVGTQVAMQGTVSKPLKSATIRFENGTSLAASLSNDGQTFTIPRVDPPPKPSTDDGANAIIANERKFEIAKSVAYWFEFVDQEGVTGGTENRYEIRAVVDQPPSVSLEQPAANLFVTPDAEIPLQILVKDDLAIRLVNLCCSRSEQHRKNHDFDVPLYAGPDKFVFSPPAKGDTAESGESRIIEHKWKLAPLRLKPGTQVMLHAVAFDYKPQKGESTARQLTIITAKELEDRFAQRQDSILAELARALKMEQDARAQTGALEIQEQKVGRLEKPDLDRLQGIDLNQRQITRTLVSPAEGVVGLIQSLLADLNSNHAESPDMERRMRGLLAELGGLERDHLPLIERELTGALKGATAALEGPAANDQGNKPDPRVTASLRGAAAHEDAVIAALERWLGDLKQWDNYRRFGREIAQVRTEEAQFADETAKLRSATVGKDFKDLTPQQQADLLKLSQRQADLGRRFDKLIQQMDAMAGPLKETEPLAAETIGDAVAAARSSGISGQMQTTGRQVERNQLTNAQQSEEKIGQDLQELLDILSDRREQELSRMVKKLREAESELSGLRKEQAGLRKKAEEAEKIQNEEDRKRELQRLSREEKELQEKIERFARRLQRLQAEQAARTASKAGGKAGKAGQAGEQGDAAAAAQNASAAEKDLDEAQEQLAKARRKAEADLANEELARLETALRGLREREQKILEDTVRFDQLKAKQQRLTRPQAETLQDLARNQDTLREETAATGTKLAGAEVFNLAITAAAADMARAVELLDKRETGAAPQQAETDALSRLSQILEAIAEDKDEAGNMNNGSNDTGDGGDSAQQGDSIHNLAELKLLMLMQVDVHRRTQELNEKIGNRPTLTDDERKAYVELGREEGRLAELIQKLMKPTVPDPEKNPDQLRDLRPKNKDKDNADDGLLPP